MRDECVVSLYDEQYQLRVLEGPKYLLASSKTQNRRPQLEHKQYQLLDQSSRPFSGMPMFSKLSLDIIRARTPNRHV